MADFSVAKNGNLWRLSVNTDAAKEWCNKHIPSGLVLTDGAGCLVIPDDKIQHISWGMVSAGLTFDDLESEVIST